MSVHGENRSILILVLSAQSIVATDRVFLFEETRAAAAGPNAANAPTSTCNVRPSHTAYALYGAANPMWKIHTKP